MLLSLGRNIKKNRERLGYNQLDLAGLVGCTQHAISNWEKGVRTPRVDKLIKLSIILKIPLEKIMDGIDFREWHVLDQIYQGFIGVNKR
jgi:repressor LexA